MRASIYTVREIVFDGKKPIEFPLARIRDLSKTRMKPMPAPSSDLVDSSVEESESTGEEDGRGQGADTWGNDDERIVRHHLEKRSELFSPTDVEAPVDLGEILSKRTTIAYGNDGEELVHDDTLEEGTHAPLDVFPSEWIGRAIFYVKAGTGTSGHAELGLSCLKFRRAYNEGTQIHDVSDGLG